jgi:exodeoxyribonuclease VII large subunit
VVTSASGAAWRDILNVLGRRCPLAEVVLSPTLVQGPEAPAQIAAAIEALDRRRGIDVIIVARGGGSMEELWAFNDERVARAIYACRSPVISGVGHETDFSIADLVADLRAPTPSAAAELAVPNVDDLMERVTSARLCLSQRMEACCGALAQRLSHQQQILKHHSPQARINTQRQTLDALMYRIAVAARTRLTAHQAYAHTLAARLAALNPEATLQRGYAVVSVRSTGHTIESIGEVHPGQALNVRVQDGQFGATAD